MCNKRFTFLMMGESLARWLLSLFDHNTTGCTHIIGAQDNTERTHLK